MDIHPIHFWYWWALGGLLIFLQVLELEIFFLWMGVSAGVVGAILWLEPTLEWQYQFMVFAVFSIVSIATWRLYLDKRSIVRDRARLDRLGRQYIGREFILEYPIIGGIGNIQLDDSTWKLRGEDCEAGGQVRVTGVDGIILLVERL